MLWKNDKHSHPPGIETRVCRLWEPTLVTKLLLTEPQDSGMKMQEIGDSKLRKSASFPASHALRPFIKKMLSSIWLLAWKHSVAVAGYCVSIIYNTLSATWKIYVISQACLIPFAEFINFCSYRHWIAPEMSIYEHSYFSHWYWS
jgi:hypothetical protein